VRVALLWHLHQPDYRDPVDGEPTMPWARLHALRGYRDLLVEAIRRPLPATINVVPSLLDQLEHYASGGVDEHLRLTAAPADGLDEASVRAIREGFLAGHPRMRQPFAALEARVRTGRRLSVGELRDLQVWSTLAWFGATARRDHPSIDALRRKGSGFTEDDKAEMLGVQQSILEQVPGLLRSVAEGGVVALSCSAYHHPILPLVVDTAHARRCLPGVPDVGFSWPDDARHQLVSARERVHEITGVRPRGLWPSEGAVSPEVAELAEEAGFRWLCSDEGVLGRSERRGRGRGAWALGERLVGFFRDTDLSDRIGFRYAERDPEEAVADFVGAVRSRGEGLSVVALDGENPWECFADAGGAFRKGLHEALTGGQLQAVRLDDEAERPPVGRVRHLHTGSWIGADLRIWYGHEEDRRAWRELAAARRAAHEHPRADEALPHLHAAEGSDWYWWYGDDFRTPFAGRFDALFRAHLAAAWRALGQEVPPTLSRPLLDPDPVQHDPPRCWLSGPLDGTWASSVGAGRVGVPQGAMARGAAPVLRYGCTLGDDGRPHRLHLRLEGEGQQLWVDGEAVGMARPVLHWEGAARAVSVQVVGDAGEAWPAPVQLVVAGAGALWTA
jgi:alpha-amylase/alpha-mannosidase (GH57 family)